MKTGNLLSFAIMGLALSGCSGARLDRLEKQVADLQNELEDVRSTQAEHTASLSEVRGDLRSLTGKAEELNYKVAGKTAELERSLEQVSSRVPPPPGVPADLLNADDEAISRIAGADAEQYRNGLRQIRSGNFDGARTTFQAFLQNNPATAFSDNAYFWIGTAYSGQGQFDRAVGSYSEVFQRYPAEDFVPAALYFMSESFIKMGQKNDAVLSLQKLADDHPKSEWASRARARLKEIAPAAPAKKKK